MDSLSGRGQARVFRHGDSQRHPQPLAEAGISVFAISTFDTDYILVRTAMLALATGVLGKHFAFIA